MRAIALLIVVLVGACSGPSRQELADRPPSLSVAQAALSSGAPDVALRICSDTVTREPKNVAAYICKGDALAAMGQHAEAEAAFRSVQQLDPDNAGALMGLGRLGLATDPVAAEVLFQHALVVQPGNAAAWNDIGIARDLQGHHDSAQQAYGRALGLDPSMRAAEVNMALSLAMSGRADEAVRRLRAIASDPSASVRLRQDLAAALAMADKPDEAAKLLRGDLTPAEIDQAIAGYRALVDVTPPSATPVALPTLAPQATNPVPPAMSPPPRPVEVAAQPPPAVPPPAVEVVPSPAPAPAPLAHQAEPVVPPAPPTEATASPAFQPAPPVAAPPVSPGADGAPAGNSIVLRVTADSWVHVSNRHGRALLNRLMHAGDSWAVPPDAQSAQLLLTTGNAGGIEILIDGQPVPSLGGAGAVRHEVPLDPVALLRGAP